MDQSISNDFSNGDRQNKMNNYKSGMIDGLFSKDASLRLSPRVP